MRLERAVAAAANITRSEAKAAVKSGRVALDGEIVRLPDLKIDPYASELMLDGVRIAYKKYRYFMMNKPSGCVSSTDDPRDKTVLDLMEREHKKLGLFPAGRLDKDAEGLLILTNDGNFCHDVISPKKNVQKRYYVETAGRLTAEDCAKVEKGIALPDGTSFLPGRLELIGGEGAESAYMTIHEGKFHQVKRMLTACGRPVKYLKRIAIGALSLDEGLLPGEYREMTADEKEAVFAAADTGSKTMERLK